MSGHSHAKNVKRKKDAENKKRAAVFSRISRLIVAAVRENGKDPQANPSLRVAIEKARENDMPKENIERAIKRGAGEGQEGKLEPFLFEAYGPENTAFIIEGTTDNKNRNLGEIKDILKRHRGKLADPGSVKWLFDKKGIIEIKKEEMKETIELEIIEAGAEDIKKENDSILIYTTPENINRIKKLLAEKKIHPVFSDAGWCVKSPIFPKTKLYKKLLEELEENESVERVYINI